LAVSLSAAPSASRVVAVEETAGGTIFLPLVTRNYNPVAGLRTVNAPYFNVANVLDTQTFQQMAIFWFGKITTSENYADVRVGYNNTELVIYLALIDRYIYSQSAPSASTLLNWDSVSVGLSLNGPVGGLDTSTYRFDLQYGGGAGVTHQAAFRGNGASWTQIAAPFTTFTTDRWEASDGSTFKGWAATYRIPFSSLGVSRPADGTIWGLSVFNQDRDSQSNPAIVEKMWPETADRTAPSSWGRLRFGLPGYSAPGAVAGTTTVRQGTGVVTPDGGVGGYTTCGGSSEYWTQWGQTVYYVFAGTSDEYGDFNIQNQSDISDWPCFSKYYITFPLTAVPANRVIRSATLTLHQFGNSQPSDAKPSYIQVLTVGTDWNEATLNWNNAPLAVENFTVSRVDPLPGFAGFPGVPRTWDVSRAMAQAYLSGQPLRLVMYSADSDYHSGKYFVSADTGDWNAVGRPTLVVSWGSP
jgi:hypothetical protein